MTTIRCPSCISTMSIKSMPANVESEIYTCDGHKDAVLERILGLLKSQTLCDVVLIAGIDDGRVTAHRLLLTASSKYFSAMFTGSFRESAEREIILEGVLGDDLERLVQYCYTGSIEIRKESVKTLLATAELLQFDNVVEVCISFLERQLNPTNCLGIAEFAEQYNLEELRRKSDAFICDNFVQVCKTDEFLELNVNVLCKIFCNDNIQVESEEIVYHSIISWIEHDQVKRKKYTAELLKFLRMCQMDHAFIEDYIKPLMNTSEYTQNEEDLNCDNSRISMVPCDPNRPRKFHQLLLAYKGGKTPTLQGLCTWTNTWKICTYNLLQNERGYGVTVMGNKIVTVGGRTIFGNARNIVHINRCDTKDFKQMLWGKLAPLQTERWAMGVTAMEGFLYVVGGCIAYNKPTNVVERWDPVTESWKYITPMKTSRYSLGLIVHNDLIYAVGGSDNRNQNIRPIQLGTVECYNPVTNCWSTRASLNNGRSRFGIAAAKGFLYVVGGIDEHNHCVGTVERYDATADTWTMVCSIKEPMYDIRCCNFFEKIRTAHENNVIQEYDPDADTWEVLPAQTLGTGKVYGLLKMNCNSIVSC